MQIFRPLKEVFEGDSFENDEAIKIFLRTRLENQFTLFHCNGIKNTLPLREICFEIMKLCNEKNNIAWLVCITPKSKRKKTVNI